MARTPASARRGFGACRSGKARRSSWCGFAIVAVWLACQWAVATYACTMPAATPAPAMAGMPCEDTPSDRPAICLEHCKDTQAVGPSQPPLPDLAAFAAPGLPVVFTVCVARPVRHPPRTETYPRQTSPPFLLSARLRL